MHTAICYGWIDSTLRGIDKEKYGINFVKRNEKTSKWSYNTLRYGKKLLEEGKMSEFGKKMYEIGLQRKPHDYGREKNPDIPIELETELNKSKKAKDFFDSLAKSYRRNYIKSIAFKKNKETREKWAKIVVNLCENGKKQ
jgi:uncharacterized protein YdeI (YjbR/CyaY-like superfamily)